MIVLIRAKKGSLDTILDERLDLILNQGQERRNDYCEAWTTPCGQLVAQRLPTTLWHREKKESNVYRP
jgi:hypothetical protein